MSHCAYYGELLAVIKKYVSFDGPERAQWEKESAEDAMWDAEWNKRHGPVPGGATVLQWRNQRAGERQEPTLTSADALIR